MVNTITNILFGLLPEVLYFTLFIIFTKGYKTNRIKLFVLLAIGYIVFKLIFSLNVLFQLSFTFYVPIILKILYKDKFHISDIFVFVYASIVLILLTFLILPIDSIFHNYMLAFVLNRILMFIFLFIFRNKLNKVYKWIISQWNRNYEKPNKIKAITIRQVCVISLNVMIFVLNFGVQYLINGIGS